MDRLAQTFWDSGRVCHLANSSYIDRTAAALWAYDQQTAACLKMTDFDRHLAAFESKDVCEAYCKMASGSPVIAVEGPPSAVNRTRNVSMYMFL